MPRLVVTHGSALLSVKHDNIVDRASLPISTLELAHACLSILRNLAGYDHRKLAVLLLNYLRRVGIDPLDRECVCPGNADDRVVLPVEFCVELDMHRLAICRCSVGIEL